MPSYTHLCAPRGRCDPFSFFHHLRPFLVGYEGVLFEGVDDEEDEDSGYGTGSGLEDLSNISEDHHHKKVDVDQGLRLQEGGECAEARTKSHTKSHTEGRTKGHTEGHIVSHIVGRLTRPRPRSGSMSSNSELAGFGDGGGGDGGNGGDDDGGDDGGGNSGDGGGGAIARNLTESTARMNTTRSRRTSPNLGTSVTAADEPDSNTPVPIAASVVVGGNTTPSLAKAADSGSAGASHGVAVGPKGGGKGGNTEGGTGRDKRRQSAVGASGAQSTIVPLVDRLLGVR